jgi:hypothetical protein
MEPAFFRRTYAAKGLPMLRTFSKTAFAALLLAGFCAGAVTATIARTASADDSVKPDLIKEGAGKDEPAKIVPLNKEQTVLIDGKGKRLLLKSKVVFRDGVLEMLLCRKQTKEHESILSINSRADVIHAGLLALGAEPGSPVQFTPDYKSPTGQRIDVFLSWTDEKGKTQRVAAQEWIRHAVRRFYTVKMEAPPADLKIPKNSELKYDSKHKELLWYGPMTAKQRDDLTLLSTDEAYRKAIKTFYEKSQPRKMEAHWVFAGSGFFIDGKTGEKHYQAEGGDVICVANFPTAMLDVDVKSSASGEENLLFEAWTEKIPPLETEVTVELIPVAKEKDKEKEKK